MTVAMLCSVDGGSEPTILADVHETRSVVPATLEALGTHVVTVALDVGDYDVGTGVLVERKSVRDFHEAVVRGRFWRQIGLLRTACPEPYLLVEGRDIDAGPLSQEAVRGICVAVVDLGVRLLRSDDQADSARWLLRLAIRRQKRRRRDAPIYAQRPKSPRATPEAMLAAIPGVSTKLARQLLAHFGSVASVVAATPDQLREVPGFGLRRAEALQQAIHTPL